MSRGPQRHYLAIHPERLSGIVELLTHPALTALCEHMLGPDYRIVEIGIDVPLGGARNQPWHRDFPTPAETAQHGQLTSLAFNVTTVDVTSEMGPFDIAPGTQWDDGESFQHGMFPPVEQWRRYEQLSSLRMPKLGDVSARTGLTIHRGTENHSETARPVLILGMVTAEEALTSPHDIMVSRAWYDGLPDDLRDHLAATVVDELVPISQRHTIEGLVMGVPAS